MTTDPIADMLNRILNSQAALRQILEMPFSKAKLRVAEILKEAGFIKDFKVKDTVPGKTLIIILRKEKTISGFKKVSKPGKRVYQKQKSLKPIKSGYGLAIVSTSKGVLTLKQAKKEKVGGEVWLEVW